MTILSVLSILAEQAKPNPLGGMLIPMLVLFVAMYMLMIRPQQKQRKEQMERINALQTGDKVITTAGIHGIVHNIKDKTVVIKVAEATMIEFDKMAITTVTKKDSN